MKAQPLPEAFAPYAWAPSTAELARRNGLRPELVIRYDQNTPSLPGVPQVPLGESFAHLNDYPDGTYGELREAAARYTGTRPQNVVVGAGADDLIALCARTFLGSGSRAAVQAPSYPLFRIATQLQNATVQEVERAWESDSAGELLGLPDVDLVWWCNPNNPTGETVEPEQLALLARSRPDTVVVVDEAYVEYDGRSAVPFVTELPNLAVIRTLSKAFGFAGLRVGYALASDETAALLEARRAPAPIAGPAARIAAAALREPRIDIRPTVAERDRMRSVLVAAGYDVPPSGGNFVYLRTEEALAATLEEQGLVVRGVPGGIRITVRCPVEDDLLLRALGADPGGSHRGRAATLTRTTTETAVRITLDLDGSGLCRVATGVGFLDHLLTLLAFHAGFDLELLAGGDLHVDEHHVVEDTCAALGAALSQALGERSAITRYGAATVPMDEAQAHAAVDLVRRPHWEIRLELSGERVGMLPVSLLPHALERFAAEAACTVHVRSSGRDDHHVAEAAFKALGRALAEACAPGRAGVPSTKGTA